MTRSYISEIKSVLEWKQDELYLYSDAHKDAYGVRYYPHYLLDSEASMEEVMQAVDNIYEQAHNEARRERKEQILWETKMWVHRLMVEEARRESNGVVYPNPDWDSSYDNTPIYAVWDRVIGPELYYFNKLASNHPRVA